MKKKVSVARVLIVAALILYTVFLFFPIITILLTSFVPSNELATNTGFVWWPKEFTFDAYKTIFEYDSYVDMVGMPGLLLGLFNTLWLTLIPLLVGLVVAGFSAYAFSKMNFPFKEKLFKFSVIIRSVPLGAFAVISYIFYSAIGWTGESGMLPLLIPGMFGWAASAPCSSCGCSLTAFPIPSLKQPPWMVQASSNASLRSCSPWQSLLLLLSLFSASLAATTAT